MTSKMLEEALSSFEAVQAQLQHLDPQMIEIAGRLRRQPPQVAMTVARGSSDHAASYFAYLTMQLLGIPVASLPMSVVTMQQAPLKVSGQVAFAFSQSGQSPDLVNSLRSAAQARRLEHVAGQRRRLAAGSRLRIQPAAVRRHRKQRRRDQELHRHPQRQRPLGRRTGKKTPNCSRPVLALPEGLREAAQQDWSAGHRRLARLPSA